MNTDTQQKLRAKIAEALAQHHGSEWVTAFNGEAEAVLEALQIEQAGVTATSWPSRLVNVWRLRVLEEGSPET